MTSTALMRLRALDDGRGVHHKNNKLVSDPENIANALELREDNIGIERSHIFDSISVYSMCIERAIYNVRHGCISRGFNNCNLFGKVALKKNEKRVCEKTHDYVHTALASSPWGDNAGRLSCTMVQRKNDSVTRKTRENEIKKGSKGCFMGVVRESGGVRGKVGSCDVGGASAAPVGADVAREKRTAAKKLPPPPAHAMFESRDMSRDKYIVKKNASGVWSLSYGVGLNGGRVEGFPSPPVVFLLQYSLIANFPCAIILGVFESKNTVTDGNVITTAAYMIDDENEIMMGELMKELKLMKVRKADEYDRVSSEMLEGGGVVVANLLYQLFKLKRDRCVTSRKLRTPLYRLFRTLARALDSGGTRQIVKSESSSRHLYPCRSQHLSHHPEIMQIFASFVAKSRAAIILIIAALINTTEFLSIGQIIRHPPSTKLPDH
ncbi:hypothetical protein EVAR_37432_1 [Eumeta japonica]|uniref:Uncharacterized protein n=1 Tax=Eumeta variegata TaxID=151549 RepID=A0A4C1WFP2_EUMVA|nr:hypothetical protein EVAR_37432_1 [Eumeta japonica]